MCILCKTIMPFRASHEGPACILLGCSLRNYACLLPGMRQVAARAGVCCHSDACLGGFVLPFARALGKPVPPFDFAVPGVTSMSVDTHKFGMAHKARPIP
jgi:hypothetical protein